MAPIIDTQDPRATKILDAAGIPYKLIQSPKEESPKPTLASLLSIEPKSTESDIFMPADFTPDGVGDLYFNSARVSAGDQGVAEAGKYLGREFPNTAVDSLNRPFTGNMNQDEAVMLNLLRGRRTPPVLLLNRILNYLQKGIKGEGTVYDNRKNKMDPTSVRKIYEDFVKAQPPWRFEWLEDRYGQRGSGLFVLTDAILDATGKIVYAKQELLGRDTLMEDKTPGISLDDWVQNPTAQGFPREDVKGGDFYSWYPRNGAGARLFADAGRAYLYCDASRAIRLPILGVRDYFEAK